MSQKIIFHVDMNAFFASVEQAGNPFLQGKPVAVVPGSGDYKGKAILARSYEAKARGVKTFSRLFEALAICPDLITVPTDPLKYYDINKKLAMIMESYTPAVEIYSIDEFFMDMTGYFNIHALSPAQVANEIKQRIAAEIHPVLKCSIGIGPNKLLAKVGSDFQKPDGLTIISWKDRHKYLDQMDLSGIWGIGRHCVPKLNKLGIENTAGIRKTDGRLLEKYVGSYWIRLKRIANGEYYEEVSATRNTRPAKTMQHAHTLAKATDDVTEIKTLIRKLAEKLAARLRKHDQMAPIVTFGVRPANQKHYGWGYLPNLYGQEKLDHLTDNGFEIYQAATKVFQSFNMSGLQVRLAVVGVAGLTSTQQMQLLDFRDPNRTKVDQAIDLINKKYGQFTVRSADILHQRAKERELSVERKPMTFHPDG